MPAQAHRRSDPPAVLCSLLASRPGERIRLGYLKTPRLQRRAASGITAHVAHASPSADLPRKYPAMMHNVGVALVPAAPPACVPRSPPRSQANVNATPGDL